MNTTPKTIQIFLPGGDPRGIRIAEITTGIDQVIEVPRSLLAEFYKMAESSQTALYFLFSNEDEDENQRVYIGQTSDLRARLKKHHTEKDFWERALVLISSKNSLTPAHTLFLESYCLQKSKEAGRYANENGTKGNQSHTPPPLKAECLDLFEEGAILLATLGYPIFSPVVSAPTPGSSEQIIYNCTASSTKGRGMYTPEGFVVLKGSVGRTAMTEAIATSAFANVRENLLKSKDVEVQGDKFVLLTDRLFKTPSAAAKFLTGGSKNGWTTWITDDGRTLDEVERSKTDDANSSEGDES
jgi:uncharacterized protein DUF4357